MPLEEIARLIDLWTSLCLLSGKRMSMLASEKPLIHIMIEYIPGLASYTVTDQPAFKSARAARHPTGPAPTTIAFRGIYGEGNVK